VAANSGLLRLQKGLEIRFANEFPGAGQEIVGFGWPIERDHFAEGIDVAQFDREFHGRVEADGKGMRHLHRVVIAEGREVFFNCPVVGRDAALAVFLISGQAEQDAHEFDTRVDAGTPGLRTGGNGASQQKCQEGHRNSATHASFPTPRNYHQGWNGARLVRANVKQPLRSAGGTSRHAIRRSIGRLS